MIAPARALRLLAALRRDRRGVSLIEFALSVPFLVLIYCGGYQLMDGISTQRKVTATVHTLADLTTQSTSLTQAQADQILAASTQVMAPYSIAPAVMRITEIDVSAANVATVNWSDSLPSGSGYAKGSAIFVPDNIRQPGTSLVYAEMSFAYVPVFAPKLIGNINFSDRIYMAPRNSPSIPMN